MGFPIAVEQVSMKHVLKYLLNDRNDYTKQLKQSKTTGLKKERAISVKKKKAVFTTKVLLKWCDSRESTISVLETLFSQLMWLQSIYFFQINILAEFQKIAAKRFTTAQEITSDFPDDETYWPGATQISEKELYLMHAKIGMKH